MNSREEIASELRNVGVDVPESATLTQLRRLLDDVVGSRSSGAGRNAINESESAHITHDAIVEPNGGCVQTSDVQNGDSTQTERNTLTHNLASQIGQNSEDEMNRIENELSRRLRILRLQREISDLEQSRSVGIRRNAVNFTDIENILSKFSGDDGYGVLKWIDDFEEISMIHRCTDEEKFIFARRLMTGSANLFLRMISVHTWEQLKAKLREEFDKTLSARDIIRRLEARIWNRKGESLHHYVLTMQEMARGTVDDNDLVEFNNN